MNSVLPTYKPADCTDCHLSGSDVRFCSLACRVGILSERRELVSFIKRSLDGRGNAATRWDGPGLQQAADRLLALTKAEVNFARDYLPQEMENRPSPPVDALSKTLWLVMLLAADAFHNDEIAWMLGLSSNTVRNYLSRVMAKLGMRSRTEIGTFVASARTRLETAPDSIIYHVDRPADP